MTLNGINQLSIPVNVQLNSSVNIVFGTQSNIIVAAGKALTLNNTVSNVNNITGTATSSLTVNSLTANSVSTFANVTASQLTVNTMTGITLYQFSNSSSKLSISGTSTIAQIGNSGLLEVNAVSATAIPKVTVTNISDGATVHCAVVNNSSCIAIPSGTAILYSTNDISTKVIVDNKTEGTGGKELSLFKYSTELRAEYAGAITLSDGTSSRNYPNLDKAFEAITTAKNTSTDYGHL